MIITRTPVRISFAGGGSDLPAFYEKEGGAVLSAAINKYFYTVVTSRSDTLLQLISSDLRVVEQVDAVDPSAYSGDLRIPMAVVRRQGIRRGMNVFMASEIPPGTGLGSSASVCVNLIRAVWTLQGRAVNPYDLAEEAFFIASEMLSEPVGKQDEYAAAFGGINEIRFDREGTTVLPVELRREVIDRLEHRILLFFTGGSRRSTEILAEQRRACLDGSTETTRRLGRMRDLVGPVRRALSEGDLDAFGDLLHEGWRLKKGVSARIATGRIDEIYEAARQRGALGGKLAGAGGGGFLVLMSREGRQEELREALGALGLTEMRFRFDHYGSRVVYNDPYFDGDETGGLRWSFVRSEHPSSAA